MDTLRFEIGGKAVRKGGSQLVRVIGFCRAESDAQPESEGSDGPVVEIRWFVQPVVVREDEELEPRFPLSAQWARDAELITQDEARAALA